MNNNNYNNNNEGDNFTNRDWLFWYSQQKNIKWTGGLGGRSKSEDHPNYNIIETGHSEKSSEDLKRPAISQTSVKVYQIMMVWKFPKEYVKRRISTSTLLENWKKTMQHEGDNYPSCDCCFGHSN